MMFSQVILNAYEIGDMVLVYGTNHPFLHIIIIILITSSDDIQPSSVISDQWLSKSL